MKRLLMVCALAGFAMACGDDDDDDKVTVDAGTDSGVDGGNKDAGPDAAVAAKVANVGIACTVATAAATCGGTSPTCASATWAGIAYPENHCEATCTRSAECGTGGLCPIGEALASTVVGPLLGPRLGNPAGVCYKTCAATTDCRTGYKCVTTVDILGPESAAAATIVPSFNTKICVPNAGLLPIPGDAGVGDGGTTTRTDGGLDGGLDGGR